MTTLAEALRATRSRLSDAGLPDAQMEARILLGGLLGLTSTEVFVGGSRTLEADEEAAILSAVERRVNREPVHRILGMREFYGIQLRLSKGTLEPRPDTEVLVEALLPLLRQVVSRKGSARLLDLGTGTGAIALALLSECPEAEAVASDISRDALETAAINAASLQLSDRFHAVESRWFDRISGCFDIIVSNPPYIKQAVIPTLSPEVRCFDPYVALDGGADGLDAYRAIACGAGSFIEPGGLVGVEIGFNQKSEVAEIFESHGFILDRALRDYGDNDCVLLFSSVHS